MTIGMRGWNYITSQSPAEVLLEELLRDLYSRGLSRSPFSNRDLAWQTQLRRLKVQPRNEGGLRL